jgi:protein-L-isoaspartate(D-aspartate) O-methyltransferase
MGALPRSLAVVVALAAAVPSFAEEIPNKQQSMVESVKSHASSSGTPISERTLSAISAIDRAQFVPADMTGRAYDDSPLPIGHGQTISQPYIVALMTELADVSPGETVLEIGTGSGYQAAVLSKLAGKVYTIEIVDPLAKQAEARLKNLGFKNVEVKSGDGYAGWAEHAPFDAIVVTAAPEEVPPPLLEQLKTGGKLVIPVGGRLQDLVVMQKDAEGKVTKREVLPVRFVPFTGER